MIDDPIYNRLRELSWQRELTGAEESELRSWLAAHPEARAEWEAEAGLNAALDRLPDAPVASNFTARVLQAVEWDAAAKGRWRQTRWARWPRLRWLPRVAFAAVVVGAGLVAQHQFQEVHRKKLAESVAAVSAVASLPGPDILQDFDAIRALNPTPPPDETLLAVLK